MTSSVAVKACSPTLYTKVRDYLHERPSLYKIARTVRFAAMVGPWRPLVVNYHRNFNPNPKVNTIGPTVAPHLDASAIASTLERAGFAPCGTLPKDCVDQIVKECGPMRPGNIYNPHEKWDAVRKIVYDSTFVGIARHYFGAEPIVCASKMWWSIPAPKRDPALPLNDEANFDKEHASTFHFDVADCKSLILFVYLTDVDADCGPHMIIEGTHSHKSISDLVKVYITDDEAIKRFGAERIKAVTGEKGTFFFEEQTAFHKGVPARKPRLILGVNYTLHRKPVKSLD